MYRLSKHQRKLLKGAVKEEHGKFTISYAEKYYSTKTQAKESLESLENRGFVDRETHGVFKVEQLPEEVYDQIQEDVEKLEAAKKATEDRAEAAKDVGDDRDMLEKIKRFLSWN